MSSVPALYCSYKAAVHRRMHFAVEHATGDQELRPLEILNRRRAGCCRGRRRARFIVMLIPSGLGCPDCSNSRSSGRVSGRLCSSE